MPEYFLRLLIRNQDLHVRCPELLSYTEDVQGDLATQYSGPFTRNGDLVGGSAYRILSRNRNACGIGTRNDTAVFEPNIVFASLGFYFDKGLFSKRNMNRLRLFNDRDSCEGEAT